jgi:hypothetical protein
MANVEINITVKKTIWFYVLRLFLMIGSKRMIMAIKNETIFNLYVAGKISCSIRLREMFDL